MFPRLRFASLLLVGVLTSASQALPEDAKFAVEVAPSLGSAGSHASPQYITLINKGATISLSYDESLRRLSHEARAGSDRDRRQPTALKLEYKVDGEMVAITASVFFGEFDRQITPTSLDNLPQEKVAESSAERRV